MTDKTLLDLAPQDVAIIDPHNWHQALEYEQVIITGTDLLSEKAMVALANKNPVVAIHHKQTRSPGRQHLINSARRFICRTPRHLEIEREWTEPKDAAWVVSPLDSSELQPGDKENFALWAARLHPQKGPNEALTWATEREIPILLMHGKPRSAVLEKMSKAKYFVFLPNGFDAEPRAVVEAVLSGCEVVTNDDAGITSIPHWRDPDVLRKLVDEAGERFWELALQ
jgi:hypothetical protein